MTHSIARSLQGRFNSALWGTRRLLVSLREGKKPGQPLFDWKRAGMMRTDIINLLITTHSYHDYLEIGCQSDVNFAKVPVPHKVGVDPVSGGTHRMTSDAFFAQNKDQFDIVFIDGLHTYEQVRRDVYNALKVLREGGVVVLHDMLPATWEQERVPRLSQVWNGTVWKVAYELQALLPDAFGIIKADQGVGIVFKRPGEVREPSSEAQKDIAGRGYDRFLADYQSFNLVEPREAGAFLKARRIAFAL